MDVVVPLRSKLRRRPGAQVMSCVIVVFEHQMHRPLSARTRVCRGGDLLENVRLRLVVDRIDRVVAQTVEAVFLEPVERIVDEEVAHLPAVLAVEVDRLPPQGLVPVAEKGRRIGLQKVALGSEMVVHDVEENHQALPVRRLHEMFQIIRRAITRVGRERQYAVVAPVPSSRKTRNRHQLDRRDAERRQIRYALDGGQKVAAGCERADVQLVNHGFVPRPARPLRIVPRERMRADHLARSPHVVGIGPRCRIRHVDALVDAKPISASGVCPRGDELVEAVLAALHRQPLARGPIVGCAKNDLHVRRGGGPQSKADAAVGADFGAKRHRVRISHACLRNCISSATDRPCNG